MFGWSQQALSRFAFQDPAGYIPRARQVRSFNPEVVDLNGQCGLDLIFETQVGLLHIGLVIIGLEDKDRWSACGATDWGGTAWSRNGSAALRGGILRDV